MSTFLILRNGNVSKQNSFVAISVKQNLQNRTDLHEKETTIIFLDALRLTLNQDYKFLHSRLFLQLEHL